MKYIIFIRSSHRQTQNGKRINFLSITARRPGYYPVASYEKGDLDWILSGRRCTSQSILSDLGDWQPITKQEHIDMIKTTAKTHLEDIAENIVSTTDPASLIPFLEGQQHYLGLRAREMNLRALSIPDLIAPLVDKLIFRRTIK